MASTSRSGRGTALVTGAHGFVGRHVARRLAAVGYRVAGLGHGDWAGGDPALWGLSSWRSADVDGEALVEHAGRPDLIVHCAGSGSVPYSVERPREDFKRTVDTTLAVLEFVRQHAPDARVVLPSSAAVYGLTESLPIRTDDPLRPISPYGVHKRMAEELCGSYAIHFGVKVAIVRLFSIYGAGLRKQLLWDACRKLTSGQGGFGGDGSETRDWLHVDDAAALMAVAADHASPACPVVNGGCGVQIEVAQVVSSLAERLGVAERPRFSGVVRVGEPRHFLADASGARAWGWTPEVALEPGLDGYVGWFKDGAA